MPGGQKVVDGTAAERDLTGALGEQAAGDRAGVEMDLAIARQNAAFNSGGLADVDRALVIGLDVAADEAANDVDGRIP